MYFTSTKSSPSILLLLKHRMEAFKLMQCIMTEKQIQSNSHIDEKMVHVSELKKTSWATAGIAKASGILTYSCLFELLVYTI